MNLFRVTISLTFCNFFLKKRKSFDMTNILSVVNGFAQISFGSVYPWAFPGTMMGFTCKNTPSCTEVTCIKI